MSSIVPSLSTGRVMVMENGTHGAGGEIMQTYNIFFAELSIIIRECVVSMWSCSLQGLISTFVATGLNPLKFIS